MDGINNNSYTNYSGYPATTQASETSGASGSHQTAHADQGQTPSSQQTRQRSPQGNRAPAWLANVATPQHAPVANPMAALLSSQALTAEVRIPLAHGILHMTSSIDEGGFGNHSHLGTYTPNGRFAIGGTSYADLLPTQPGMKKDTLDAYKEDFDASGDTEGIEPIDVSPNEHGQLQILDGHHRFAAAVELGLPVEVKINPEPEEMEHLGQNWAHMQAS